jgi:hypothetical protein
MTNLKDYNKLLAAQEALCQQITDLKVQYTTLDTTLANARKEIRNQVDSTYAKGKTSATMKFNGRVLKLRINQRGDSVFVTENGTACLGWFPNGYQAEFAFATGQI